MTVLNPDTILHSWSTLTLASVRSKKDINIDQDKKLLHTYMLTVSIPAWLRLCVCSSHVMRYICGHFTGS